MPEALPPPTWRTVEVDGAPVEVMEAGTGEPMVFLHGWGLTPRAYAPGVTRLTAAGVRVIAPSLPGFGGSAGPGLTDVSLRTYGQRVGRLLDVLGVDAPVFLVGHSFGGGVAIELATQRPERVRSLTLVNSVGGAPSGRTGLGDASWVRWAAGAVTELQARELVRAAPGILREFLPMALRRPVTLALTARAALRASLADEAAALVAQGLPVLFIWGDKDRLIAPGALAAVAGELPAEVVHGRHGWLLTDPVEFAALMRDALVVHAMLERRRRGHSGVLPPGARLADIIPVERRARHRS